MGTTLTGTTPQDTYDSLIKVTDNGPLSGTAKYLSDGLGNDSALALSTGNIGIGTTSPSQPLVVFKSNAADDIGQIIQQGANGTAAFLNIVGNNDAGASFNRITSSTSGGTAHWQIGGGGTASTMVLLTGGSERMRITSNGYVRLATASGGIQFNGDTAAANALDDYEEGTWTPSVAFGGASVGVVLSVANGATYTKIGRQVTVNGFFAITSKGSSTGAATITGLPFTIGNGAQFYAAASLFTESISFVNVLQGRGDNNTTTIQLFEVTEAGVLTTITNADFTDTSNINLSLTYFV
jgi:hypothetical protein